MRAHDVEHFGVDTSCKQSTGAIGDKAKHVAVFADVHALLQRAAAEVKQVNASVGVRGSNVAAILTTERDCPDARVLDLIS
jgi:hypothetical protein